MAESKMEELAQQLLRSAKGGTIQWSEGVGESYGVHFPDISLLIKDQGTGIFELTLINGVGEKVESLRSYRDYPIGQTLREIHDIARRQMSDIDGTIDKALEYLRRA